MFKQEYSPKVILVTGAAGFIGSNYVRRILNQYDNIKVISFDKLTYAGNLNNLANIRNASNHVFVKDDICCEDKVLETLKEYKVDTIVHFAAESHVDNSISIPKVFLETNVMGTFNLVNCAKKYCLEELGLDGS